MEVKVRKVGNSYILTIPKEIVRKMNLRDGQIMELQSTNVSIEYRLPAPEVPVIDWDQYSIKDSALRDGKTAEEYVRSLRDDDRGETVF